jgi:hypothetical protein
LARFEAPYTSVSCGLGVPPEGTCEPFGLVPPYIFNQQLNSWQAKRNHGRPVQEVGQVGHADPPQGKVIFPKVREFSPSMKPQWLGKLKKISVLILGQYISLSKALSFSL